MNEVFHHLGISLKRRRKGREGGREGERKEGGKERERRKGGRRGVRTIIQSQSMGIHVRRAYDNSRTQDKIQSKLTIIRPIPSQKRMYFSSNFRTLFQLLS